MLLDALRSARLRLDPLPLRGAPPSYPLLGHALAMRRDPLRFLTRLAAERGPMAPLHLGPVRGYLVSGPTELEAVFRSKAKLYTRRTRVYDAMALFLGHGILTSEGEHWRKHRRIVQPAFHRRRLESWADTMVALADVHMDRWREEVDAVLGQRPPTAADVPKLTWARWVLDESMRLYPPAWTTGRFVAEAHELGGVAMAPGTFTLLSPWVTHRDPELWDDPEGFDPARWEALSKPGALPPFQFYPFGGGPRKCVGEAFAYLEATLILARIAQRLRLDLVPGHVVTPAPQITLGFEGGLKMHAAPRA